MKKILFKGCGTALITPFKDNAVNYEELEKLIEYQISQKIDSLIICGTTGESSCMTTEEKKQTIEFALKIVKKRVPVIAGTGGNCTSSVIEFTKWAETAGVDGALIVTPYYNKTTQVGLIAHYRAIAESTKLPIILYNVPGRTGINITPETCFELSKITNIVAIKEASGDISQMAKIKSLCRDNLQIYSGNDDQILPILSLGGIGVISVLSNIAPLYTHDIVEKYFSGDVQKSTNMQLDCINIINALFSEVNPIPVKAALNMLGYDVGIPRLPLVEMSEKGKQLLKQELINFGLLN